MVQTPPGSESNDSLRLERCQQRLGYEFRDVQLLEAALTHASGADHRLSSNERLEFLGDAILGLVVCEQLFTQFPDQSFLNIPALFQKIIHVVVDGAVNNRNIS